MSMSDDIPYMGLAQGRKEQMRKAAKNNRILDMYIRLNEGKLLSKSEEAVKYGVNERSIQRDIDDIRAYLEERTAAKGDGRRIVYDREKRGYVMAGAEDSFMSNSEILAVSKILLESRAFTKKEIGQLLNKLIQGCVPSKNMKLVSDLISNEKYHYVELRHTSSVMDKMWELGNDIKECELIELSYEKQVKGKEHVTRIVEPAALLFSEYYFYLLAYIVEESEKGYCHLYDYPAIFRLDRIKSWRKLGIKFKVPYADRFQEGEFRKRIQFMFAGELQRMQFRYSGSNIDVILDRIPSARIISSKNEDYLIEAEVFGKGILMWLLSQGSSVEVIKPKKLREEMIRTIQEILKNYHTEGGSYGEH